MSGVAPPPFSPIEPVVDVLHGVPITDPYRWLEDQNSPRTRAWIDEQTLYARAYLDALPGRDRIRQRVRELLDVETYDSFIKSRDRYFLRKRLAGQEQPCIYFRDGFDGQDQLLIDPSSRGTGNYTAVKPLRASLDGSLLLYEVKQGGERTGIFEILDVANRRTLPDVLPRGYLRGFAFAPDGKSFYYVHEAAGGNRPFYRAAYHHVLGTDFRLDPEIFFAGENENLRLGIVSGIEQLGLLVYRFPDNTYTDFYLYKTDGTALPLLVLRDADYSFAPRFLGGRIVALVNRDAPNRRIVSVQPRVGLNPLFSDIVPANDAIIRHWTVTAHHIVISYLHGTRTYLEVFDTSGKRVGRIPSEDSDTIRLVSGEFPGDEILLERESFLRPVEVVRYSASTGNSSAWIRRKIPFDPSAYAHTEVRFTSKDGTQIPMFLLGRRAFLEEKDRPVVMTAYGGYGVPRTPQFSVFVTFLIERGCLFALPNIRGGSEFGADWHNAARRQKRQVAFDDFLCAAEWLIRTGRTTPAKLAIFGGSNSGLLVATAMTQRPDLFGAGLCMVPLTDMLRYHLFDDARVWKDELGTADDVADFNALSNYSPYHAVRPKTGYPATMIVSGDADQNCNALHARKMTARLQAANISNRTILLDYSQFRGHSSVLPLAHRVNALTDRLAFLSAELGLTSQIEDPYALSVS